MVLAIVCSIGLDVVASRPAFADGNQPNACGCYRDSGGSCFCTKKGKCACPGECEPKGCEEKRAKQMQKDIAAETKKAADDDRKERQSEGNPGVGSKDETKPRRKPVDKDGVGQ